MAAALGPRSLFLFPFPQLSEPLSPRCRGAAGAARPAWRPPPGEGGLDPFLSLLPCPRVGRRRQRPFCHCGLGGALRWGGGSGCFELGVGAWRGWERISAALAGRPGPAMRCLSAKALFNQLFYVISHFPQNNAVLWGVGLRLVLKTTQKKPVHLTLFINNIIEFLPSTCRL